MDSLSRDLIQAIAAEMQGQTPDDQRTAELAAEAGRLNGAVRRESRLTGFEDDPVHFFCALEQGAR
jgi:hypothetical protein